MTQKRYRICEGRSGETFSCGSAENILAAAARSGSRLIRVGCRNGGCGVCKIRVLKGRYRTGKMSRAHVDERQQQEGFALACRTTPASALEIEVCVPPSQFPDLFGGTGLTNMTDT